MLNWLIPLLPLVASLPAVAGSISDPNGLLDQIDRAKPSRTFAEQFTLGDSATVRRFNQECTYDCSNGFCISMCTEVNADFDKKVAEVTADDASAVYNDGVVETYLKSDADAYAGSWLRKNLAEFDVLVGKNGTVVLEGLNPIAFPMADGSTVPAQVLTGHFTTAGGDLNFEYTLGNDVPGIAEILFLKILDEKIFKVKAFARGAR